MVIEKLMEKKILGIIPARGGSKRIFKKNVRLLCGKPLIGWSIEGAKKSKYIDKIVVSTEDDEIKEISTYYGAMVITRPNALATDESATFQAVLHVLESLKATGYVPEYVILLQCTSPMRTVNHIDEALEKFYKNEGMADGLISVTEQEIPPWKFRNIDQNGFLVELTQYDEATTNRVKNFQTIYRHNGAIYINKVNKLLETGGFETSKTISYIMDHYCSIDIDTDLDFRFAECLLST